MTALAGRIVALALALAAGGCAATGYKPAVDKFAAAAGQAKDAYVALQGNVLAAHTDTLKARVRQGQLLISPIRRDCETGAQRCRLEVMGRDGRTEPLQPELGNVVALLSGIVAYAANLQAIVDSDAPQKVGTSLAAAGGSLKSLGDEVAKQKGGAEAGADLSAFAQPAASVVAWLAGEYLNLLQLDALRTATREADPVIHDAAGLLGRLASLATEPSRADLARQVRDRLAAHDANRADGARLDALVAAAADYDKVLVATNPDVFGAMATAHRDLARSLSGQGITAAQAFAAVQDFARRAEALRDAIDALMKADKARRKGKPDQPEGGT